MLWGSEASITTGHDQGILFSLIRGLQVELRHLGRHVEVPEGGHCRVV